MRTALRELIVSWRARICSSLAVDGGGRDAIVCCWVVIVFWSSWILVSMSSSVLYLSCLMISNELSGKERSIRVVKRLV